jgi:hypothetical protein
MIKELITMICTNRSSSQEPMSLYNMRTEMPYNDIKDQSMGNTTLQKICELIEKIEVSYHLCSLGTIEISLV